MDILEHVLCRTVSVSVLTEWTGSWLPPDSLGSTARYPKVTVFTYTTAVQEPGNLRYVDKATMAGKVLGQHARHIVARNCPLTPEGLGGIPTGSPVRLRITIQEGPRLALPKSVSTFLVLWVFVFFEWNAKPLALFGSRQ